MDVHVLNAAPRGAKVQASPLRTVTELDHARTNSDLAVHGIQTVGLSNAMPFAKPYPPLDLPRSMLEHADVPATRSGLRSRSAPYRRTGQKLGDTSASQLADAYIGHLLPEDEVNRAYSMLSDVPTVDVMDSQLDSLFTDRRTPIRTPCAPAIVNKGNVTSAYVATRPTVSGNYRAAMVSEDSSKMPPKSPIHTIPIAKPQQQPPAKTNSRQMKRAAASARLPTSHLRLRQELDASRPPTRQRNAFPTFLSDAELIRDVRLTTRRSHGPEQQSNRLSPVPDVDEDADPSEVVRSLAADGGRRADFYARELRLQRQQQARAAAAGERPGTQMLERAQIWHNRVGSSPRGLLVTPSPADRVVAAWHNFTHSTATPSFTTHRDEDAVSSATLHSRERMMASRDDDLERSGTVGSCSGRITAGTASTSAHPRTAELGLADVIVDDGFEDIPVSVEVPIVVSGSSSNQNNHRPLDREFLHPILEIDRSMPTSAASRDRSAFMRTLLADSFMHQFEASHVDIDNNASLLTSAQSQHTHTAESIAGDVVEEQDELEQAKPGNHLEDDLFLEDTNLDEGFISLFANGKSIVSRSPFGMTRSENGMSSPED